MTELTSSSPRKFWGYAAGYGGISMLRQIIVFMPLYFYSPPAGRGTEYLLAVSVGLALFVARVADVVSDPIVGWFSDRTRHPWGKRLPYIVFGTPIWLLATMLIFLPPAAEPGWLNFLWLTAMAILFFMGNTVVQIPYMAVLPEIAGTEETAIRVSARMGKFYIGGALVVMTVGWYAGSRFGFFRGAAIVSVLAGLLLALAIRDLFSVEQHPRSPSNDRFFKSAWSVIREKPFWTYLFGYSLFVCGYYTLLVASPYFVTEVVRLPQGMTALFFLLPMLVAMAAAPGVERATLRFGKKPVLLTAMLLLALLALGWFAMGQGRPGQYEPTLGAVFGLRAAWAQTTGATVFFQALALFTLIGLPVSVLLMLPPAMVADLVVYDARTCGRRRESLVYGLQGGIEKNAVMIATLAASLSLERGKDMANVAGIRMIGPVAAALSLAGCLVFMHHPLRKGWQKS